MSESISINPLKMTDSYDINYTESVNDLKSKFKEIKKQMSNFSLASSIASLRVCVHYSRGV